MNADQIKSLPVVGIHNPENLFGKPLDIIDQSIAIQNSLFLKEIAYQLAVMNERPRCSQCIDIIAHDSKSREVVR